jgi:hypothetical protein
MSVASIHRRQIAEFFTIGGTVLFTLNTIVCDYQGRIHKNLPILNIACLKFCCYFVKPRCDTAVLRFVQTPIVSCFYLGPDESLQGAGAA